MRQPVVTHGREEGFSLVELMVTLLIALVILGGLVLNFTQQHSEYKYQMKRIDAVQDLEFAMKFIAEDMRGLLWSGPSVAAATADPNPVENNSFAGTAATTSLTFWRWDQDPTLAAGSPPDINSDTVLAKRKYVWNSATKALRLDRLIANMDVTGAVTTKGDNTGSANSDMLPNVTFFKVFKDDYDTGSRASFSDIPAALPVKYLPDAEGNPVALPGYTILIEIAVDAGYKVGSFLDVKGVDVRTTTDKRKRVWRYVQVYPMSLMAEGMMLVGAP